jgi:hypothetical protein
MKTSCLDRFDRLGCEAAMSFCSAHIEGYFFEAGLNVRRCSPLLLSSSSSYR